jgi:phage-related protein
MLINKDVKIIKKAAESKKKEEKEDKNESPFLLKLLGIVSTIGTIATLVYLFKDKIIDFFLNNKFIKNLGLGKIFTSIKNAVVNGISFFSNFWEKLKTGFKDFIDDPLKFMTSLWNDRVSPFLSGLWDTITGFISPFFGNIKDKTVKGWNSLKDTVKNLWSGDKKENEKKKDEKKKDGIAGKVSLVWDKIKSFFAPITKFIADRIEDFKENILPRIINWFKDNKDLIIDTLKNGVIEAYGTAKNIISKIFPEFDVEGFENNVKNIIQTAKDAIDNITKIYNWFEENIKPIFNKGGDVLSDAKETITKNVDSTSEVINTLRDENKSLREKLTTPITDNNSTIANIWNTLSTDIAPKILSIYDWINERISVLDFDKIGKQIDDVLKELQNTDFGSFIRWFKAQWTWATEQIEWFKQIWESIKRIIEIPVNILRQIFEFLDWMWNSLIEGLAKIPLMRWSCEFT